MTWGHRILVWSAAAAAGVAGITGCAGEKPVIPRAAFVMREAHRDAVEGADSTIARLTWPDFVGARTPAALESLRAGVRSLVVAPRPGAIEPAPSGEALLDDFITHWNERRKSSGRRAYWRLERRVEVLADTLGVVALAAIERADTAGAAVVERTRLLLLDADHGRRLAFEDLFGPGVRDTLGSVLERMLRAVRGGEDAAGPSSR